MFLLRPEVQYELLNRFNEIYDLVFNNIKHEINLNGKKTSTNDKELGLEMVKIVPIVNRQDSFTTWRPYEGLAYKIYFE